MLPKELLGTVAISTSCNFSISVVISCPDFTSLFNTYTFTILAIFSSICLFKLPIFIIKKPITVPVTISVINTAINADVVAFLCIGFTAIFIFLLVFLYNYLFNFTTFFY